MFLQRFYSIQSYKSHDRFVRFLSEHNLQIIAAGCCFLAAKVEESFRKPDDIANQFFVIHPNNEVSSIPVGASSTH